MTVDVAIRKEIDHLGRVHRMIDLIAKARVHEERLTYLLFSVRAVDMTEDVNSRRDFQYALQQ